MISTEPKDITKVSEHIYNKYPEKIDNYSVFVSKIYKFNLEGISILNKLFSSSNQGHSTEINKFKGMSYSLAKRLTAHFYIHAENAANKLFYKTRDNNWAEKAYGASITGAVMLEDLEVNSSISLYNKAGKYAYLLSSKTKGNDKVMWLKKASIAYENYIKLNKKSPINEYKKLLMKLALINEQLSLICTDESAIYLKKSKLFIEKANSIEN